MALPHSLSLEYWETGPENLSDVMITDIEQYFHTMNLEAGVTTGGQKALREGRSMAEAEGRVRDIQYHEISSF